MTQVTPPAPTPPQWLKVITALLLGLWLAGFCEVHAEQAEPAHPETAVAWQLSSTAGPVQAATDALATWHGDDLAASTASDCCHAEPTPIRRTRTVVFQPIPAGLAQRHTAGISPAAAILAPLATLTLVRTRPPAALGILRH